LQESMAGTDFRSGERSRRPLALAGLRQTERRDREDTRRDDDRWPPWLSILFIAASSLGLWSLIMWGVWWLIA
jgi:hypothetical protein